MTASAAPVSTTKPASRSGLWTFLRLLGGWATVAVLAYLLSSPSKEWGWPTLLFAWVLLVLLADEFAGWFGYIALVLGVLPLLWHTPPEQWFVILPLVGGALFALLIVKHSGGPFVLPFAGALFAGTLLVAGKLGPKLDPGLTLPTNHTFQNMALRPMILVLAFSFVRQLVTMIVRWQAARRARAAAQATVAQAALVPGGIPAAVTPAFDANEASTPGPSEAMPEAATDTGTKSGAESVTGTATKTVVIQPAPPAQAGAFAPIDLDLSSPAASTEAVTTEAITTEAVPAKK